MSIKRIPTMSTFSITSTASSSSYGPLTPNGSSPCLSDDTPVTTPPGSLRDYASALKASHSRAMAKALQSIPLERPKRRYEEANENPFDILFNPTSPTPRALPRSGTFGLLANDTEGRKEKEKKDGLPPFKPALLQFRSRSDVSTPTSEASFEVGGEEERDRMYGDYSPFDLSAYMESAQASPIASPFESVDHRASILSQSTITSTISSATVTSQSSSSTVTAQLGVANPARLSRPSLMRPRPRAHPYDSGRQRESSGGSARSISFTKEEDEMRADGRSVSEVMVALAGFSCQRTRGGGGGRAG